ncbi:MAG: formylglycine-generating enzyme family protein [Tannerella sp.]|jgi:formylglycine-generating enzyme required for sulfatase activity|nr:formylglycine-generating enzyme family protein [Tannerella sp.]
MKTKGKAVNVKHVMMESMCLLPFLFLPAVAQYQPPEIEMIFVEGGSFMMGCTPEQGAYCNSNERPVHQVTVKDFYIGKCEVTQAEWESVMGENPSYFHSLRWDDMVAYVQRINERSGTAYEIPTEAQWNKVALPVEGVSWNDVQEFIRRLNALTGKNYRLPTEAEWEYAARGGEASRNYKYSGASVTGESAWYGYNSGGQTHPVGVKKPNELGIHDMNGNVWEWCSDWYGRYSGCSQADPQGAQFGSQRVIRGGSWNRITQRISIRENALPGESRSNLGFRLACSFE